jgi:hypothetical protein
MIRSLQAALMAATLGVTLLTGATVASASSTPGAGCGNGSSAINQYCENVPSANGRGTPPPGTPDTAPRLGTTLPQAAVRAIDRLPAKARKRARRLLSLPAPVPVTASLGHQSGWSLPLGVIIAMIAVAAAGGAAAVVRWRRNQSA